MEELIAAIRTAIAEGATAEQRAVGAQACRTILTALDAEPGKPIALPGAPTPHPLSTLNLDQALDLVIARLAAVADTREAAANKQPEAARRGPQIPMVRTPPGALPAQRPKRRTR